MGKGFGLMWHSAKKLTLINLFLYILLSVLPLLSLVVLKYFIDDLVKFHSFTWEQSGPLVLYFFLLQAGTIVTTELSAYFLDLQQQVISNDMSGMVLQKAIELDLQYFEDPAFQDELYMVQQQSLYRPAQLITAFQGFVQSLITIILFSGFLISVHWSIPLLLLVLSIPLAITRLMQGYQQYLLAKNCSTLERRSYDLFDYLTNYEYAKEVRIFNYGTYFIDNFTSLKKAVYKKGKRLQQQFLKYSLIIQFFEIGVTLVIYGIIIQKTVITAISIGGLVVYLTSFQRLQGAINSFYQGCINLFQQQLYLQQVLNYLAIPVNNSTKKHLVTMPGSGQGISVHDLSFCYPGTAQSVLKNISMQFDAGKITAIVGENGSGKSTLVKLLCRLYEVKDNSIFLGDTDVNTISQEEYKKNVTTLFQDFGKYYLSIKENIRLNYNKDGNVGLEEATKKSGFNAYISSFAFGYDTQLGRSFKNGKQLSGGQWQKLALSRAFYKKGAVLILDEPTSSLDPVSEYEVLNNLKKELDDEKIIILISHRLYNLKMADRIYVLSNGSVTESGTFDELMKNQGKFYNTYKTQMV